MESQTDIRARKSLKGVTSNLLVQQNRAWCVAQMVEHLPGECEALHLNPNTTKEKTLLNLWYSVIAAKNKKQKQSKTSMDHLLHYLAFVKSNCHWR
jgi:hypothetical protein